MGATAITAQLLLSLPMALSAGQAFIYGGLTLITFMNLVLVLLVGHCRILVRTLKCSLLQNLYQHPVDRKEHHPRASRQVSFTDTMHIMINPKTQDRALLRVIWAIPRKPGVSLVSLLTAYYPYYR